MSILGVARAQTLKTERAISYIRLGVVALNVVTYLSLGEGPGSRRGLAMAVIVLASIYAVGALYWAPRDPKNPLLVPIVDTVLDNMVIALWLFATGGFDSPYFPLLYAEAAATVGRFGVLVGAAVSAGTALMYVFVVTLGGAEAPVYDTVVRVDYVFVIVAFVGYVVETSRRSERSAWEAEARADALDELSQLKTNFVSTISHELRTPLTAIRGAATTLKRHEHFERAEEEALLGMIDRQSQHLSRLVQDLIDVSLVDRNRLMTQIESVDLTALVEAAIGRVRSESDRDLTLEAPDEAIRIVCDKNKVRRVIDALLDNAVKFSSDGMPVEIRLRDLGSDAEIEVEDHGVGIDAEQQSLIFDRFYQVDSSPTRLAEGAGIGLAVAQELVRLHGGTIAVHSVPSKGSRFTVRLPKAGPTDGAGQRDALRSNRA